MARSHSVLKALKCSGFRVDQNSFYTFLIKYVRDAAKLQTILYLFEPGIQIFFFSAVEIVRDELKYL